MKTKIVNIIIALSFVFISNAQIIRTTDVDKIVYEEMIRQELPGLAIGVFQAGRINYTKGYGYQNLNRTKPITNKTPMRWASISKTLTAVAALQLDEKRTDFSINNKVAKHYPYWISKFDGKEVSDKTKKSQITIKNLLNNRSGVKQYGSRVWANRKNYNSDTDNFNANSAVDIFRKNDLEFTPGTNYKYTTQGFNLLGAVIDKKSGSYTGWVNNNIKNRLGLTTLKISTNKYYKGFQKSIDGIINTKSVDSKEWVLPGGGWESNIKDLLRYSKGILQGKLLKNTANLWIDDGNKVRSKSGKMVSQDYKRGINSTGTGMDLRVWHGGSHANLRTLMYIMPKRNIAVVVMIPAEYADTWNIVRKVVDKMGVDRSSSIKKGSKDKCTDDMGDSSRRFVGVWQKTDKNVIIRRGYTSNNFNKEWNFLKKHGYQVFDIEAYNKGGKLLWDGVFKKTGSGYAMWRNYDYEGFKTKYKQMTAQGYRLYDLETYTVAGKRKWAGLFKKSKDRFALHRNLSTENFKKIRDKRSKEGRKLVDIEVYEYKGQLKWSGVWLGLDKELLNRNYDTNEFKKLVTSRFKKGYRLIDVETYTVKRKRKWAGIWEKNSKAQKSSYGLKYCDIMDKHAERNADKHELIDLESY